MEQGHLVLPEGSFGGFIYKSNGECLRKVKTLVYIYQLLAHEGDEEMESNKTYFFTLDLYNLLRFTKLIY